MGFDAEPKMRVGVKTDGFLQSHVKVTQVRLLVLGHLNKMFCSLNCGAVKEGMQQLFWSFSRAAFLNFPIFKSNKVCIHPSKKKPVIHLELREWVPF